MGVLKSAECHSNGSALFLPQMVPGFSQRADATNSKTPHRLISPSYGGKLEHMGKKMSKARGLSSIAWGWCFFPAGLDDAPAGRTQIYSPSTHIYFFLLTGILISSWLCTWTGTSTPFFACTNMMLKIDPVLSNDRSFLINSSFKKGWGSHRFLVRFDGFYHDLTPFEW